jgi:hypothetical protein
LTVCAKRAFHAAIEKSFPSSQGNTQKVLATDENSCGHLSVACLASERLRLNSHSIKLIILPGTFQIRIEAPASESFTEKVI